MRLRSVGMVLLLVVGPAASAKWQPITTELLAGEKPGYGGLCGVLVDHSTGRLYVSVSDRGVFQSDDQGQSWRRVGDAFKGRTEWPGCMAIDPTGRSKRLVVATVYGAGLAVRPREGAGWTFLSPSSTHIDWAAVDWADAEMKLILALRHESGGMLLASRDGGKTFSEVGKGYGPAWVFDDRTAVAAGTKSKQQPRPGLLRTNDGGKSFKPCSDSKATALPRWRDGTLYWLVEGALIATTDKGQSWRKVGDLKDGRYGPVFGKDAKQMFVLTGSGISESTDGGTSWSQPLPLPTEVKNGSPLTWIEYDPAHGVLYAMRMGSQLYKQPWK